MAKPLVTTPKCANPRKVSWRRNVPCGGCAYCKAAKYGPRWWLRRGTP